MSDFNFSRHKRTNKTRLFYAMGIVCLIAFGAAAFFGLGMPTVTDNGATADASSSTASIIYRPTPTESIVQNNTPSKNPSKPTNSSQPEIFKPSEVTQVVTPSASFFVMPITGDIIKDYDGEHLQYSLTLGDWRPHEAIDIKGVTGDRINAAGDGTVTSVYTDSFYGLTVEINHGNEITGIYSGLEQANVKAGDIVGANDEIGTLGKVPCESVETTHLHFSIKSGDKFISPMNIIGVTE